MRPALNLTDYRLRRATPKDATQNTCKEKTERERACRYNLHPLLGAVGDDCRR
jgi:hypothetical protein